MGKGTERVRAWLGVGVIVSGIGLLGAPVAANAADVVVTPVAQIGAGDVGKTLTVQGTVIGTQNFSRGFRFALDDRSAQIVLLVNESDWDTIAARDQLNMGAVVQVTGRIRASQGTLQIVPSRGRYVKVLSPAANPWRKYHLGAMNGNDHNAVVWVQGTITGIQPYVNTRATPYEYGTELIVTDETGAQRITIRDVAARHLTQRANLAVGQPVSVVGRVFATSKVGIEIRVSVPSDVILGIQPGTARS